MPGTHPTIFWLGGRQREYHPQYYYVLSDIADQYWLPSVRSASSRFHSAIRRHQFASVRQADSRLTRLVPPNLELALTPLQVGSISRARAHTSRSGAKSSRLRDRAATSPSVDCAGGRPLWTKQWLGWAHATRLASPTRTHTHTQLCVERRRAANTKRGTDGDVARLTARSHRTN